MYTIIEDCSPYYIRFTHDGIDKIVDICKRNVEGVKFPQTFTHYKYPEHIRKEILDAIPLSRSLDLNLTRASLFVTHGGRYYQAHKDGIDNRLSLNYTIEILDDKCVTSWYSDDDLSSYNMEGLAWPDASREAKGFDKTKHTPIKSMIAKPNECILFNTDIWHDFDNSQSTNRRMVLTLRVNNHNTFYFDDARKALFGF